MHDILLVGLGAIGIEYTRVLNQLGVKILSVGRSEKTCIEYTSSTNIKSYAGGLSCLEQMQISIPTKAIVAVSEMELGVTIKQLINIGVKSILVEKPGFGNFTELSEICFLARSEDVDIRVAYNRRFYSSVIKAKEIIKQDGGLKSFNFEFTEWSHTIVKSNINIETMKNWFWHNSTHILDLAFHFGGLPNQISTYVKSEVSWHKNSIFAGAGITEKNIPFSYIANWSSPGRWGLELQTNRHRLIFRPIELLHVQLLGSTEITKIEVDDFLDKNYKPGFFRQIQAFLNESSDLLSIFDQELNCRYYEIINK